MTRRRGQAAQVPVVGVACSQCGGRNVWLLKRRNALECDDCGHSVGAPLPPGRPAVVAIMCRAGEAYVVMQEPS